MIKKITLVLEINIFKKFTFSLLLITLFSIKTFAQTNANSVTYFEDFNSPGYPTNLPAGGYWTFHNEIHPTQDTWEKFIPGDGNAYITVDADITNDTDWIYPFQTLEFGGVSENHRLEVRMKGAVVDGGLVGFLFTYHQEGSIFNEVDIEVVANDSATPSHETLPSNNGWTDARFNTWRNANENTNKPFTGTKKAVVNQQNEKISLVDDQFHTYTIDWRADRLDFFIDGVIQETITSNIATGWAEVIIGFRQLPWAGDFKWSGTHTMVIDYLKIEPLENITFALNDSFVVDEDRTANLDVLANDSSNTTIIAYDAVSTQGFPVTETSSLLTYTPTGGYIGQDSFTYTIEDANGVQATATVFINVQKYIEPLKANDDAITLATNSLATPIDVTANDFYGLNGPNATHPLTLAGGKSSTASNLGNTISVVDGKVNYTPKAGFLGIDTFEYTITDSKGFASKGTVTVTVGGAVSVDAVAMNDSFSIDKDTATNLDVLTNDTPGASIVSYDTTSVQGFIVSGNSSTLTYSPTGGFTGTDTFTYTIAGTNGVQSIATVTLNVTAVVVGEGPLNAVDDVVTITIGSSATPIDVLANDSFGANGPNATHALRLTNGKIFHASTMGADIEVVNGKVNYTPKAGFSGIDTFDYTITDSKGFASKGIVTVTVGGAVSVDAVAVNDSFSVDKDTAKNLDVLANDTPSSIIVSNDLLSTQGFPITKNTSILTYTPSGGFTGTDSFTYTIAGTNGVQSIATVTLTVSEQVVATGILKASNDTATVATGSSATPIDVLANDSFGANGPNATHALRLTNGKIFHASTMGADIEVVNGKVNYTPKAGFSGIDTFEYTITDSKGFASRAIVTVTVGGAVSVDAVAVNDSFSVDKDTATNLDVLTNDTSGASIVSFDTTSAQGFTVSGNSSTLTYSPTGGFTGTDSFTYTIAGTNGVQSTATVTLTVKEIVVATGPLNAINDVLTVAIDSPTISIDVTANDSYGSNGENATHPLTLTNGKSSTASNKGGDISVVNGKVNYTPKAGFSGVDSFDYTITDSKGFADKGYVMITVGDAQTKTTLNGLPMKGKGKDADLNVLENNIFSIYPNPSNGYVKTTLFSNTNTKGTIVLMNVTGKVVYNAAIDIKNGNNEFELNLNLAPGIVFMKVLSSEVNFGMKKMIIK